MNELSVDGCRAHREELLAELRKNYTLYGMADKLTAAWHAVTSGLALSLNPVDPLGSLFDLAVSRSESHTRTP